MDENARARDHRLFAQLEPEPQPEPQKNELAADVVEALVASPRPDGAIRIDQVVDSGVAYQLELYSPEAWVRHVVIVARERARILTAADVTAEMRRLRWHAARR